MRIFYIIFSIILLTTAQVKSQTRSNFSPDPDLKVIKFYPNPAISVITFDFQKSLDKSYTFQIYNFLGKKVYEAPSLDEKTMVNLSEFFRGVYIFQLKDQAGRIIQTGKFQVIK
ncbi:MAG: T9SS type A sorting domain-containing protein [Chitinophagales bacterium]